MSGHYLRGFSCPGIVYRRSRPTSGTVLSFTRNNLPFTGDLALTTLPTLESLRGRQLLRLHGTSKSPRFSPTINRYTTLVGLFSAQIWMFPVEKQDDPSEWDD